MQWPLDCNTLQQISGLVLINDKLFYRNCHNKFAWRLSDNLCGHTDFSAKLTKVIADFMIDSYSIINPFVVSKAI